MRVLVACWPFTGHVHGQLSVATALAERGHEVVFYTGEAGRPTVEAAGFRVIAMQAVDEAAVTRSVESLELAKQSGRNDLKAIRVAFREWLVETIPAQISDLKQALADFSPDVIQCDMSMWGPQLVLSDLTSVPVVVSSTFLGPMLPGPDAPPAGLGFPPPRSAWQRLSYAAIQRITDLAARGLRARVDEIRADNGLGPLGCPVNEYTGRLPLTLIPSVPELDYSRADLPPTVHYVGPCAWLPAPDPAVTAWLDELPTGQPWVHVTESTLRAGDPFLLRAAVQGLAAAPVEVIATTGAHRDPSKLGLGTPASNVHLTSWVNHSELLPRCSVTVTTGGAATITSSLAAGVPIVVVPTTWDKPDNARRVTEAGVGVRLSPRQCSPEHLREAVLGVLADKDLRLRARQLGQRLSHTPGPKRSAELIERVAAGPTGSAGSAGVSRTSASAPRRQTSGGAR